MTDFRLLAIDIDGTLVDRQDNISPATCDALQRAREAGVHVVLATGRRYSRALPLAEHLGFDVPLITASGALIKEPLKHATLFRASFGDGLLAEVLRSIDRAGHEPVMYGDTYLHGFDYYCRTLEIENPELSEYFELNPGCERLDPQLVEQPPEGIFAGFAMGTRDVMQELATQLDEQHPGQLELHVLRSPRYVGYMCEIIPSGVSKWSAICHLADDWGIAAEAVCAVGDDVNDIPMIRSAGLGVAMGNALPEVKQEADRIAPPLEDDGLVDVVAWLLADAKT